MKFIYFLAAMLPTITSLGAMETPSLFEKSADYIAARLQKPEILNNFLNNPNSFLKNQEGIKIFPNEVEEYISLNIDLEKLLARVSPFEVTKTINKPLHESRADVPKEDKVLLHLGGNKIILWDTKTNTCIKTLTQPDVFYGKFNQQKNKILLICKGNKIKLINIDSLICEKTFNHCDWISDVCITPDEKKLLIRDASGIKLWNFDTGLCEKSFKAFFHKRYHQRRDIYVQPVKFNRDGTKALVIYFAKVKIWDIETHQCLQTYKHTDIEHVKFSSNEKRVITFSKDTIKIWDANTGVCDIKLKIHNEIDFAISNTYGIKTLISGRWDNKYTILQQPLREAVESLSLEQKLLLLCIQHHLDKKIKMNLSTPNSHIRKLFNSLPYELKTVLDAYVIKHGAQQYISISLTLAAAGLLLKSSLNQ